MGVTRSLVLGSLLVVGCGGVPTTTDDETYFTGAASAALGATGNQAACATCHSTDGTLGRSGNSMKDIAFRASFKGGGVTTLLGGANACIIGWMGGPALTATDAKWLALETYLQSISSPAVTTANALVPEVLASEAAYEAAYAGGNASAGAAAYAAHCSQCHDSGLKVGSTSSLPKASLKGFSVGRIAQKVRTSGGVPSSSGAGADTTPGPMPFFEPVDLSADDLKNIIAHLKT
ncbi:MAG: c-type cytochrome [Myxococcaceae bacterium]|nr:c-type cytochrome [Myxococcaceae bacterium]